MNKQRKTSHILNVFQYDADGHVVLPASLTLSIAPGAGDNNSKVPTTAWVRTYVTGLTYLTGNQSITVSGDATGSGTTSINLTLANTAVTPGTYGSATLVPVVTVDSKGRITSVTTASISGALTFTGDVTGTGTTGSSTQLTLANSGVTAGTFTKVTVDSKGRVTVGANATTSDVSEGTNLYYTDARVLAYLGANNYATQSYVSTQINNLVSGAPGLLDTLDELAQALGDDPNFATTTATSLGNRLRIDTASQGLNSTQQANGRTNLGLGTAALSATGDFATAAQGTKADTAHGWGNHASAGYLTSATAATTYLTQSTAASTYLTSTNAASTYLSQTSAGNTYLTLTNAASTYLSQTSASNTYLTLTNAASTYLSQASASSNYLTLTNAASTYLTQSSASSSYVSLSGSYANPSWITSLAYSKITGVPAFLTSYTETDTLASVTARGASTTATLTITRTDITNIYVGNAIYFGGGNNYLNWTNNRIYSNVGIESASTISASNFSGSSSGTNTGDQTLSGLGGQPQLNGTGFVKISGTTISYDNSTYYLASNPSGYISGNQNITLSGEVTGSGATSIVTTIANNAVTTAKINNGAVTAAKLATFGAGEGLSWAANTDGASIKFESTGDGGSGGRALSNLVIALIDNADEGLRVTSDNVELFFVNTNQIQYKGANLATQSYVTSQGYLTGITSLQVTNALGYTPYNSSNPSGYITGNQTITLSGDVSGSGTTSISVTVNRLTYQGNYANNDVGTTRGPDGLSLRGVYTNGYPIQFGNILHMKGWGAGQLLVGWSGTDGAHADNYIRSKRDNDSGAWSSWAKVWTDANLTNLNQLSNGPGYITGYTETDTLASVTGRGATTSSPITVTASEGREVAVYMPSSYTTDELVSGHEYGWYNDHWRLGMTRSSNANGADFVIQWNAGRRLSLTNGGNLTVTGTINTTAASSRFGNLLIGQGTYKNSIQPVDDVNMNLSTPSGAVYVSNILYINGSTAWHAGNLTNLSQLTNGPGYVTGGPYIPVSANTNATGWVSFSASTQGTPIIKAIQQDTSAGYYLFQGVRGSTEVYRVDRDGGSYFGGAIQTDGNIYISNNGGRLYFDRPNGATVGAVGWHTNDVFYLGGHPDYGPGAGNTIRVYGFGSDLSLGNANAGDVITINNSGTINTNYTIISSGGSGTTPTLVLNRNIATPSNYYNGLQLEIRATSGTAGIGLHRNGFSHIGIYHDAANSLKFDMNAGTVVLNHNTGTVWGTGNLTNLNQLSNGPGYITGESDTLATVTSRGNTTTGSINVNGNILMTGTATTTNQARTIDFTGFDKEGVTDFSDRAYIQHTTNTGGHTGTVLVISSENDAEDGIAFLTNASSKLKHNSNNLATESFVTSQGYVTGGPYLPLTGGSISGTLTTNGQLAVNDNIVIYGNNKQIQWNAAASADLFISAIPGTRTIEIRNGNAASPNYAACGLITGYATFTANVTVQGNLTVSSSNTTGNGIILADDGDIVDLNDAYCSMRFSYGVRIYSANRGGSPVITLANTGVVTASSFVGALSGNATTASSISGFNNPTTAATANTIVYRDGSGDVAAREFVLTASTIHVDTPSSMLGIYPTTNQVVKFGSAASRNFLNVPTRTGGDASGTWGISISGNANTSSYSLLDFRHSDRDFPSGTLVQTNINYAVSSGDAFILEIRGNSYFNTIPFDVQIQGYIYDNTIISTGGYSNGKYIDGIRAINHNGNLCFWWPSGGYWEGFNVKVYAAFASFPTNRVTSITNSGLPTTNKQVNFAPVQSLHSGNFNSYAPSLTGGNASGTWGINITGSAATATDSTKLPLAGGTLTGNLLFANSGTTKRGIQGVCGDNDFWFIGGGATGSNAGFLEIATGDDGQSSSAEPIYVRQYGPGDVLTGTLVRTAALLDANGNTSFPGTVTAPTFSGNLSGNATNITAHTINQSVGTGNTPTFAGAIIGCGVSTGRTGYAPGNLNIVLTSSTAGSDGVSGIDFRSGNNYPSDGASIYYENSQTGSGEISRLVFRVENDLNDSILMRAGYHVYNARTVDNASQGVDNPVFRWQYLDSNRMTLDSSGNLVCNGDITAFSDAKVKTDVKVIENSIEKIQAIRGVTFLRTDAQEQDKEKRHAGVIAQEVLEVLPEVVTENNEGMYSVAYGNLVALLIEGMKEQQTQIEDLKSKLDLLTQNK